MTGFSITATGHGRIFNNSKREVNKAEEDMLTSIGEEAAKRVKKRLGLVLRNPTGYYKSKIKSDFRAGRVEVHDSGVIYGPWLEGISSRNAQTRFKGYRTFRKIAKRMENDADGILSLEAIKFAKRLES